MDTITLQEKKEEQIDFSIFNISFDPQKISEELISLIFVLDANILFATLLKDETTRAIA